MFVSNNNYAVQHIASRTEQHAAMQDRAVQTVHRASFDTHLRFISKMFQTQYLHDCTDTVY